MSSFASLLDNSENGAVVSSSVSWSDSSVGLNSVTDVNVADVCVPGPSWTGGGGVPDVTVGGEVTSLVKLV